MCLIRTVIVPASKLLKHNISYKKQAIRLVQTEEKLILNKSYIIKS